MNYGQCNIGRTNGTTRRMSSVCTLSQLSSTAGDKWPKEKTMELIELLRGREVLWNSKNKDYKNKYNRSGIEGNSVRVKYLFD